MVTDDEIVSSLFPAEEEEDDDESSSKSLPTVFTKDAVVAFNFLQQGDIEINYKAFRALKRKVELHSIAKQKQTRIDSFVID